MNSTSRVRWEIDVDAQSAREAARKALDIQRDPASTAVVFTVAIKRREIEVDLWDDTKHCIKCHRTITNPVLAADQSEKCARCADPE